MMNDSVREELLSKVSISKPLKLEITEMKENLKSSGKLNLPSNIIKEEINPQKTITVTDCKSNEEKNDTGSIASKPTSPTLVEFHSKNSAVPEWRVQLQNAVRQRHDRENPETPNAAVTVAAAAVAPRKTKLATRGATALKAETLSEKKPSREKNPTLSSALERIEKSRQKFLVEEEELAAAPIVSPPRPANKNFPFYIAKKAESVPHINEPIQQTASAVKTKLTDASLRSESGDLDTNKLPPLPEKVSASFAETLDNLPELNIKQEEIKATPVNEEIVQAENAEISEEFEDFAPIGSRFNAGFFDLIIGAFISLFLLSPFMLTGGEWFTFTGFLAFLATCSIVMFVYLTTTIGFYGRTFGMRIFSLEVIDVEGENYPTLHQAAVSSAVYLLSLALGGIGFLTLPFNEEKRAVHDLVSGTIVVKES